MHNFTPLAALIGGILIGLSASAMLLLEGKIAGISGICAGVLLPVKGATAWKASFVAGLLAGGVLLRILLPSVRFRHHSALRHARDSGIAGRLRHAPGQRMHQRPRCMRYQPLIAALDGRDNDVHRKRSVHGLPRQSRDGSSAMKTNLVSFGCGIVFALGSNSGMTQPSKVIGFLDFAGAWDLSLAFVMIGAIGVYFVAFRLTRKMRAPLLAAQFAIPTRSDLDAQLILGATLFGAGWGLSGFCPGPAITSLASGALPVAVFVAAMAAGMYLHAMVQNVGRSRAPALFDTTRRGFLKKTAPAQNHSTGAVRGNRENESYEGQAPRLNRPIRESRWREACADPARARTAIPTRAPCPSRAPRAALPAR